MIEIKNRFTDKVLFKSETATTIKEAVEEAVKKKAYLSRANLSGADLSEAYLSRADLLFCKMDKKVFKQITEGWFEWKVKD